MSPAVSRPISCTPAHGVRATGPAPEVFKLQGSLADELYANVLKAYEVTLEYAVILIVGKERMHHVLYHEAGTPDIDATAQVLQSVAHTVDPGAASAIAAKQEQEKLKALALQQEEAERLQRKAEHDHAIAIMRKQDAAGDKSEAPLPEAGVGAEIAVKETSALAVEAEADAATAKLQLLQQEQASNAQALAKVKAVAESDAVASRSLVEAQAKADSAAARLLEARNAAAVLKAKAVELEAKDTAAAAAAVEQAGKEASNGVGGVGFVGGTALVDVDAAPGGSFAVKGGHGVGLGNAASAPDGDAAEFDAAFDSAAAAGVSPAAAAAALPPPPPGGNSMLLLSPLEKEKLAANMAVLGITPDDVLTVYKRVHSHDLGSAVLHILWTEVHAHQPLAGHKLENVWQLVDMVTKYVKVSPIMDNALKRLDALISVSTGK